MPDEKNQLPVTQEEFTDRFRKLLPNEFRTLSNESVLRIALKARPELQDMRFRETPTPDPGFIEGLTQPAKEQFYRLPETAVTTVGSLLKQWQGNQDTPEKSKARLEAYEAAKRFGDKLVAEDESLQAFQKWAGENPFSWGKFFTNPTTVGQTLSSVVTSMGAVFTAGAVGGLLGGPVGAIAGATMTGYALESGEAAGEAYHRAKEKGLNDQEVEQLMNEAAFQYGAIASVLESIVPLTALRAMGLGKKIAKQSFGRYAARYVDNAADIGRGGQDVSIQAMKEFVGQNLSIANKIQRFARFQGLESVLEAGTEASQYLSEAAILDNKIDGTEITWDWFQEKLKDPELHQSIAGGLMGGFIFGMGGGIQKYRGLDGRVAAREINENKNKPEALRKAQVETPEEYRDMAVGAVMAGEMELADKVEFARELIRLEGGDRTKPPEAPKVEPTVEPEPTPEKPPEAPEMAPEAVTPEEEPSVLGRLVTGERVRDTEAKGENANEKAMNYFLENPEEAVSEINKLPEEQKDVVLDMAGQAIEQMSKPKKRDIYDKEGNISPTKVMSTLMSLSKKGARMIEREEVKTLEGTQVARELRTEEEIAEQVKESPAYQEQLAEQAREMTAEEALGPLVKETKKKVTRKKETPVTKIEAEAKGYLDAIKKSGKLTEQEFGILKNHPKRGVAPLIGIARRTGNIKPLRDFLDSEIIPMVKTLEKKAPAKVVTKKPETPAEVEARWAARLHEAEKIREQKVTKADKRAFEEIMKGASPAEKKALEKLIEEVPFEATQADVTIGTNQYRGAIIGGKRVLKNLKTGKRIDPGSPLGKKIDAQIDWGQVAETPGAQESLFKEELDIEEPKREAATFIGIQQFLEGTGVPLVNLASGTTVAYNPNIHKLSKADEAKMLAEGKGLKLIDPSRPETMEGTGLAFKEVPIKGSVFGIDRKSPGPSKEALRKLDKRRRIESLRMKARGFDTGAKVSEVLSNIAISSENPMFQKLAKYAKRYARDEVKLMVGTENIYRLFPHLDPTQVVEEIEIKAKPLTNFDQVFLHEVFHSTGNKILMDGQAGLLKPGSREQIAFAELNKVFNHVKRHVGLENIKKFNQWFKEEGQQIQDFSSLEEGLKKHSLYYGVSKDIREFWSEALTNPTFQRLLNGIEYQNKRSVWQKILDIVRKLLGIGASPNSALSVALENVIKLQEISYRGYERIGFYSPTTNEAMFNEEIDTNSTDVPDVEGEGGPTFDKNLVDYYEGDTGVMFDRFLANNFRVLLTESQFSSLADIAKEFVDVSFRYKKHFDEYRNRIFDKLKSITGQDLTKTIPWNQLKSFYQSINNSIFIDRKGKGAHFGRNRVQGIIVPDGRNGYRIEVVENLPEKDIVTNKSHPRTEQMNFLEDDQAYGINNKLIFMSTKSNLYVKEYDEISGNMITRLARVGEFDLNPANVHSMNMWFGEQFSKNKELFVPEEEAIKKSGKAHLYFFFAETSGDNSQVVFSAVPPDYAKYGKEDFKAYIEEEFEKGLMKDYQRDEFINSTNKAAASNKYIYAQTIGMHEKWKSIKGKEYLLREESVSDLYKRLKLDLTKGIVPLGSGDSSIMMVNSRDIEIEAPDETGKMEVLNHMFKEDKYAYDGWLMTSANYMNKLLMVTGSPARVWKTVVRDLKPNVGLPDDYIAVKMLEMTPFEGTRIYRKAGKITGKEPIVGDLWEQEGFKVVSTNLGGVHGRGLAKQAKDRGLISKSNIDFDTSALGNNVITLAVKGRAPETAKVPGKPFSEKVSGENIKLLESEIDKLIEFARANPDDRFNLPFIGLGFGEGSPKEIIPILEKANSEPNIFLISKDRKVLDRYPESFRPGVRTDKTRPTRELVATYENGTWRDTEGNQFDRIGTQDEVKDSSGYYDFDTNSYKIRNLPEKATRIIFNAAKSADRAASPLLAHDLAMEESYMKDKDNAQYKKNLESHYDKLTEEYLDVLYNFKNKPKEFVGFVKRKMQKHELPKELDFYTSIFKDSGKGLFLPAVMQQIIPMLNNRFLVNGIHKGVQFERGKGTKLYIKPRGPLKIEKESVAISFDNKVLRESVIRRAVEEETKKTGKKTLIEDASPQETLEYANNYLKNNDFWVLVHRQPIQSFTKVQPRKIEKFISGGHGEVVFMNESDVFNVHEADHDGDHVHIEVLEDSPLLDSMIKAMRRNIFKARDRIVDLNMFKKGNLGRTVASVEDRVRQLANNVKLHSGRGSVVNAKTMLSVMSYKGMQLKVNIGGKSVTVTPYSPSEKVTLKYMPLDPEKVESFREQIEAKGDEIIIEGENRYLRTTKENEFSILLQAVVDNEKFGLFNNINMKDLNGNQLSLHQWLLTRLFKRDDGKQFNKKGTKILNGMYKMFNYGRDRRGEMRSDRLKDMNQNIRFSRNLYDMYFDFKGNMYNIEDIIPKLKEDYLDSVLPDISYDFTFNGRITPTEYLLTRVGKYDNNDIETRDTSPNAVKMEGPVTPHSEQYDVAHLVTIDKLEDVKTENNWTNMSEKDNPKEIKKGTMFGASLYAEFMETLERTRKRQQEERGLSDEVVARRDIKFDYATEFKDFFEQFYEDWKALSPTEKKWSTIQVLKSAVRQLPPPQLMDEATLKQYGDAYFDSLFDPGSTFKAQVEELKKLTTLSSRISEIQRCN